MTNNFYKKQDVSLPVAALIGAISGSSIVGAIHQIKKKRNIFRPEEEEKEKEKREKEVVYVKKSFVGDAILDAGSQIFGSGDRLKNSLAQAATPQVAIIAGAAQYRVLSKKLQSQEKNKMEDDVKTYRNQILEKHFGEKVSNKLFSPVAVLGAIQAASGAIAYSQLDKKYEKDKVKFIEPKFKFQTLYPVKEVDNNEQDA